MRRIEIATLAMMLAGGCAASHQAAGPRVSAGYTDRDHLVALQLRDAAGRGPSSGARGLAAHVGGNICGTDVAFDAEYWGRFMSISGFATNVHSEGDNFTISNHDDHHRTCSPAKAAGYDPGPSDQRPVELEVRDSVAADGKLTRTVRGSVGEDAAASQSAAAESATAHGVDLRFTRDALAGEVGLRSYDLRRQDDDFVGSFTMNGHKVPFILRGADELWSMPAAAQAAILPLLLTCTEPKRVIQRVDLRDAVIAER
jgi:hypothetical protein